VQSSSQIITTNKPTSSFLQAGCPSCRPTNNVKALKGNLQFRTVRENLVFKATAVRLGCGCCHTSYKTVI